jgi:hypothetical protein
METKLDFGQVFDRTADIYKTHLRTLIGAALVVFAAVFVVTLIALLIASSGGAGIIALMGLVVLVVTFIGVFAYEGIIIRVVQNHGDGSQHTLDDLWRSVTPVLTPLIFTSILAGLCVAGGLILLIVPGVILLVHFAVVAPVVVVERVNYGEALKRSWNLVKGNAWIVFAVLIVLNIALAIAGAILGAIGSGIANEAGGAVARFVANVFIAPLPAIAGAVMYFALSGAPSGATGATPSGTPAAGMPGTAPAVSGSTPPPPPPGPTS